MIIDELKMKYGLTSEQLFDIQEPLDYQCNKISKCKNDYQTMFKEIEKSLKLVNRYESVQDFADDISSAVWGLDEDSFEELRTAIEEVRAWGQEWKDLCKKIINENPELIKQYVNIEE